MASISKAGSHLCCLDPVFQWRSPLTKFGFQECAASFHSRAPIPLPYFVLACPKSCPFCLMHRLQPRTTPSPLAIYVAMTPSTLLTAFGPECLESAKSLESLQYRKLHSLNTTSVTGARTPSRDATVYMVSYRMHSNGNRGALESNTVAYRTMSQAKDAPASACMRNKPRQMQSETVLHIEQTIAPYILFQQCFLFTILFSHRAIKYR
jgi:hypothetical protein